MVAAGWRLSSYRVQGLGFQVIPGMALAANGDCCLAVMVFVPLQKDIMWLDVPVS